MYRVIHDDDKREEAQKLIEESLKMPCEPVQNDTGVIAFDICTTGISAWDEILQISILDGNGKVLLDTPVKPYWNDEFDDATINCGIRLKDVENAPYAHELAPKVKAIFDSADVLVSSYGIYAENFLSFWGIDYAGHKTVFMHAYAEDFVNSWNSRLELFEDEYYGYDSLDEFHTVEFADMALDQYKTMLEEGDLDWLDEGQDDGSVL